MNRRTLLVVLAVVAAAVALLVTNPSEETHMQRIRDSRPGPISKGLTLAAESLGAFTYHNYGLFSTVTSGEDRISVGLLGNVWVAETGGES